MQAARRAVAATAAAAVAGVPPASVDVPGLGSLSGVEADGVASFLGVPYAAAPVGDLRWRPPVAHGPWRGPRAAAAPGAACLGAGSAFPAANLTTSEDCLFLNVAAPSAALGTAAGLPVLVWFHGGGYSYGASTMYDAGGLVAAANGSVVVVTVNFRLNAFGFLGSRALLRRSPNGTGNFGIEDQRLALRWVRGHIAAFGGDAARVAIAGQSSGGHSVLNHLVRPPSFGLYSRAIVESGTSREAIPLTVAEGVYAALLAGAGCLSLRCLLDLPAPRVEAAAAGLPHWGPVIDAVSLTGHPQGLIAGGAYNRAVPVMIGSNRDEWASFALASGTWPRNMTEAGFDGIFSGPLGGDLAAAKEVYSPTNYSYPAALGGFSPWWWAAMRVATDSGVGTPMGLGTIGACAARSVAAALVAGGTPGVWSYLFAHPPQEPVGYGDADTIPGTETGVLAPHGAEVAFVFGGAGRLARGGAEAALSRSVAAYWAAFAAAGAPSPRGLPAWPRLSAAAPDTLLLDAAPPGIRRGGDVRRAACDFWDARAAAAPRRGAARAGPPGGANGTVAGHPAAVWNPGGGAVVVMYHGLHGIYEELYPLARNLSALGYCVVVPQDCSRGVAPDLKCAAQWGIDVAADVRDRYAAGRPVSIVGHSMGGGSAIAAAKFTRGLAAYAALHPAPQLSGDPSVSPAGPILFTTGSADDGQMLNATAPQKARAAYDTAGAPRAFVNVRGNGHFAPVNGTDFGGAEYAALVGWLACFARRDAAACGWVRGAMCRDPALAGCAVDVRLRPSPNVLVA